MMSYTRGYSISKIGALVVLASCVFMAAFAYMTDRTLDSKNDLFVRVPTAEGLKNGDAVLLRGVQVGVVKSIGFSREHVVVRARLRNLPPLSSTTSAALVAADMFGRQSLVLKPGEPTGRLLQSGDTIEGTPPGSLTAQIAGLSRSAGRMISDTTVLLLHGALSGMAEATEQIAELANRANVAVQRITEPVSLAPLQAQAESMAVNLNHMTQQLDSSAQALRQITADLQDGKGTAGKLLRDDTMYLRVNDALASLNDLLVDVRKNPKRYISIKIF